MARPDKTADVAELVESFQESAGAVLTEYRGLTVKQLQDLRRALGENANYAVVKNTLTKIAANEAGVEGFDDLLIGPTAIAFINGDVVEAAKGLRDFAKANPSLVIKGGFLDGQAARREGDRQAGRPRVARGPPRQARGRACWRRSARPSTCSTPRSRRPPASRVPCRPRPSRTRPILAGWCRRAGRRRGARRPARRRGGGHRGGSGRGRRPRRPPTTASRREETTEV